MKRTQKRPWYRKPAWLVSIAAVLVALGVVLFFLLYSDHLPLKYPLYLHFFFYLHQFQ